MLDFAEEKLATCIEEAEPLLRAHWDELARNKDRVPLAPDLAGYFQAEERGRLLIVTARRNGELVGYSVWFYGPHPHYHTTIFAENDVLWLAPECRNGRAGLRLIEASHAALKAHGVTIPHWREKNAHPALGRLLKHLGYVPIETIYAKVL